MIQTSLVVKPGPSTHTSNDSSHNLGINFWYISNRSCINDIDREVIIDYHKWKQCKSGNSCPFQDFDTANALFFIRARKDIIKTSCYSTTPKERRAKLSCRSNMRRFKRKSSREYDPWCTPLAKAFPVLIYFTIHHELTCGSEYCFHGPPCASIDSSQLEHRQLMGCRFFDPRWYSKC